MWQSGDQCYDRRAVEAIAANFQRKKIGDFLECQSY
jgi:hypothetical protein